jgi:hypothetical protein
LPISWWSPKKKPEQTKAPVFLTLGKGVLFLLVEVLHDLAVGEIVGIRSSSILVMDTLQGMFLALEMKTNVKSVQLNFSFFHGIFLLWNRSLPRGGLHRPVNGLFVWF